MFKEVLAIVFSFVPLLSLAQKDTVSNQVHSLEEVDVVASHRERIARSTMPLQVLGRGDMLKMGVTDIADALHRLPGITLRDYGGAGGMKTVAVRGLGSQHTGVSYDGILLSDGQSGEIDVSRYSLDQVSSLSLAIGDQEDLFIPARNVSTAAVLSIQTLPEHWDDRLPHLTSQLRLGSFGFVSPYVRYEQQVTGTMALSATGEYVYAENDYPFTLHNGNLSNREHRTNSRMNTGHGELNFQWKGTGYDKVTGKVYYYENNRRLPGQVRYYTNDSREQLHDRNFFTQLQYVTLHHGDFSFKWNGKYNWSASSYKNGLYTGGVMDADYWQREYYSSMCVLYAPNSKWTADYSVDYAFHNLSSSLETDVRPYRHSLLQSLSAKYTIPRLAVLARVLHSLYVNGAKEGEGAGNMRRLSPSLSLSYQLLERQNLFVRASYKNIFRVPTFNEYYFFHYGSTDLKPEITDQYNVGVTYRKEGAGFGLLTTLDGYLNHVRDKIVAVPYNMFVWKTVNVGKVRVLGVDAMIRTTCRLNRHQSLLLTGNYSYQRAANRTSATSTFYNHQIAYIPVHSGSISLGYENPWVNVTLHGSGVSKRWSTNEHYEETDVAGYMDWGVSAYRQFFLGKHPFTVRGDIKNLFNQQYSIVAGYPMPGISYQITVTYKL